MDVNNNDKKKKKKSDKDISASIQPAFSGSKSTMETPGQCVKCSKLTTKASKQHHDVVLVSLLLTLNRFHTLFWCFHCWLQTSKYQLGLLLTRNQQNTINTISLRIVFENQQHISKKTFYSENNIKCWKQRSSR